jgi:transcriptional regulator with XRE-family HTH domain
MSSRTGPPAPASRRRMAGRVPDAQPRAPDFGELLKAWRTARRYSQLELALQTQVSQRHLSFLESGRAKPSRQMALHLAQTLRVPLRERNQLLMAAGFAPVYPERALESTEMAAVRQALETTLRHHEPFPALVVDRQWNLVLHNAALDRLIGLVGSPARVWLQVDPSGRRNLMRLTLHPQGLQPLIVDWPQTAAALMARLQNEAQANPANAALGALLTDLRLLPGVPRTMVADSLPVFQPPVLTLKLQRGKTTLELFSMICSFGTAIDLTADELRLELLFPSDAATAQFLRAGGPRLSTHRGNSPSVG